LIIWLGAKSHLPDRAGPLDRPRHRPRTSSSSLPYQRPTKRDLRALPQSDRRNTDSGFQPPDGCTCGGSWVRRENKETGGRFFACSRYPQCKKTRDQVLRARLGSRYPEMYCSKGHEKAHFGVVHHPLTGREFCRRCIEKGYVVLPSTPDRGFPANSEWAPQTDNTQTLDPQSRDIASKRCRNGHLRTETSTYVRPDGSIECRICRKDSRG
jgi:ssDNA-binding Zn-finger/Zn-ribbon topoisomerase 1